MSTGNHFTDAIVALDYDPATWCATHETNRADCGCAIPDTAAKSNEDQPPEKDGTNTAPRQHHRHVALTTAASITPRPVRWLWDGRLALGTLGLLAGREGLGKSTLAYWIAARLTRGELPGEDYGKPRAVLVAATEDSWAHTIVPRLMAAGADLSMIYKVEAINADDIEVGLSLPHDLNDIEMLASEVDAGLLILDPLMSRLGALDTHKDAEVRQALEPLVAVADRGRFAILGLLHHNKSGSTDPLQLVMGSKAFTAVARSVHTVVEDPDEPAHRLFGTPKNNLGSTDLATLTFTITSAAIDTDEGTAWTGQLQWGEDHTESIQSAMGRSQDPDERSATTEAAEWLEDWLATQGGEASSADAKKAAKAAGHSDRTLKRASERLRVEVSSSGFPRMTYWSLPVGPTGSDSGANQSGQPSWGECVCGLTDSKEGHTCRSEPVGPSRAKTRQSGQLGQSGQGLDTGPNSVAPLDEDTFPELTTPHPEPVPDDPSICPCGNPLHQLYINAGRRACPGHDHLLAQEQTA